MCLGFGPLGNVMQRPYLFFCFSLFLETFFGHFFWDSLRTPFGDPFWGGPFWDPLGNCILLFFLVGKRTPGNVLQRISVATYSLFEPVPNLPLNLCFD